MERKETKFVSSATVTEASPDYSAGDLVGGKLTFTGALNAVTGTGMLMSVLIEDAAAQAGDVDLVIFESNPSSTTFTENSALAIHASDLSKVVAVVKLASTEDSVYSANAAKFKGNLWIPVRALSSTSPGSTLYGAMVARETINLAGTADLTVTLAIVCD